MQYPVVKHRRQNQSTAKRRQKPERAGIKGCKHTSAHNMKTWKPSFARVQTPEGLCVEAAFCSPLQPLFRSPQTWMRQIAAVASRHCCNFTDAVTCPGRSTKLFAFQCRKHSPVSQLRDSTQHSRANAPPSPCRQCCLE